MEVPANPTACLAVSIVFTFTARELMSTHSFHENNMFSAVVDHRAVCVDCKQGWGCAVVSPDSLGTGPGESSTETELSALEGLGPFPLPVGRAPSPVILFQKAWKR